MASGVVLWCVPLALCVKQLHCYVDAGYQVLLCYSILCCGRACRYLGQLACRVCSTATLFVLFAPATKTYV